jgi:polyisoprenoid-binding protein YceI
MFTRLTVASVLACVCGVTALAADPAKPAPAAPAAPAAAAAGGTVTFDFADMKGVNAVSFTADSTLEPIFGIGGSVGGKVVWNPADPKAVSGEITIPTAKLTTANDGMTKAMLGGDWLNAEKNPTISVKFKSVKESKAGSAAGTFDMTVVADLSLAGTTKEITIPVSAAYMPGRLADRTGGRAKGDLLVLRTNFSINRSDFGIYAGKMPELVSEKIEIRAAIAGARKEG